MEENYKIKDKQAVVDFLAGKGAVAVGAIIAEAGADRMRVYPILQELMLDGVIAIVDRETLGAPKTVVLK